MAPGLFFDRSTMRSVFALAIAATAATIVVVCTWLVRAALFVLLVANVSRWRWSSGNHRCAFANRLGCGSRRRNGVAGSVLRSSRLATRFFFGALLGFFFSLLTGSIFYCATLIQFTLALGLDFFRAALYENFLFANFNADALATSHTQGAGGFTLQRDLAWFFHFRLVTVFK